MFICVNQQSKPFDGDRTAVRSPSLHKFASSIRQNLGEDGAITDAFRIAGGAKASFFRKLPPKHRRCAPTCVHDGYRKVIAARRAWKKASRAVAVRNEKGRAASRRKQNQPIIRRLAPARIISPTAEYAKAPGRPAERIGAAPPCKLLRRRANADEINPRQRPYRQTPVLQRVCRNRQKAARMGTAWPAFERPSSVQAAPRTSTSRKREHHAG